MIELIVTVVMIGLISTVLAAAITVIFRSEDSAVRVAAESHDTQQGVNFFPLDVQAGPTDVGAYDVNPASGGCSAAGTNVLDFVKGIRRVSYRLDINGDVGRLDRYTCTNTGTSTVPVWSDVVRVNVADTLDATLGPAAAVTLQTALDGSLASAELTLSQQNTDAVLVASPRAEPRSGPGDCTTENPIEAARGFGTFTETDVVLQSGAVTGYLAVGGTLRWESDITVAFNTMSGVDPDFGLYAVAIDWAGDGTLPAEALKVDHDVVLGTAFQDVGGDFLYEFIGSTENFIDISGPPGNINAVTLASLPASEVIDFTSDFDELRDCSAQLARALDLCAASGCAEEVAVSVSGTNVNLCPDGPRAQILNLPESYLAPAFSFTSVGPGCTGWSQTRPLIVNVIDDGDGTVNIATSAVDWATVAGDTKNIVFNFPNAFDVNITADFFGQVLAPFAHVTTDADIEGGIIGQQWTHVDGTVDSAVDLFDGGIDWP